VIAEGCEDGIGDIGGNGFEEVSEDFEGVFFISGCGHIVAGQEDNVGLESGAFIDEIPEKGAESTNMEVREVEDGFSVQGVGQIGKIERNRIGRFAGRARNRRIGADLGHVDWVVSTEAGWRIELVNAIDGKP